MPLPPLISPELGFVPRELPVDCRQVPRTPCRPCGLSLSSRWATNGFLRLATRDGSAFDMAQHAWADSALKSLRFHRAGARVGHFQSYGYDACFFSKRALPFLVKQYGTKEIASPTCRTGRRIVTNFTPVSVLIRPLMPRTAVG